MASSFIVKTYSDLNHKLINFLNCIQLEKKSKLLVFLTNPHDASRNRYEFATITVIIATPPLRKEFRPANLPPTIQAFMTEWAS